MLGLPACRPQFQTIRPSANRAGLLNAQSWRLIIVWLEVRVLPAPPRSPAQTEISRFRANRSELAAIRARILSLQSADWIAGAVSGFACRSLRLSGDRWPFSTRPSKSARPTRTLTQRRPERRRRRYARIRSATDLGPADRTESRRPRLATPNPLTRSLQIKRGRLPRCPYCGDGVPIHFWIGSRSEGSPSRRQRRQRRQRLRCRRQRLRSPRHRLRFQSSANLSPASSITLAARAMQIVGRDIRVPLIVLARLAGDVQAAVDISHFGT